MGGPKTKPTDIHIPKVSQEQVAKRFEKRYDIAVHDMAQKVFIPPLRSLESRISRAISRAKIKPENFSQDVDPMVKKEVQDYIRQNPGSLVSMYLKKYGFPYRVEISDADEKPSFAFDPYAVQSAISYEAGLLCLPGQPYSRNNIWGIANPEGGRTLSWFVDDTTFQGGLAVQVAKYLDPYLRKPLNVFKHNATEEQKPELKQFHVTAGKDPNNKKRSAITLSRT